MESRNSKLLVLARSAPPTVCGVSDYAYHIIEALTGDYASVKLGVAQMPSKLSAKRGISVRPWKLEVEQFTCDGEPSDLLLNYTPFSYSKSGCAIDLVRKAKRFKKANSKNRIYIHLHEAWSENPGLRIHHKVRAEFIKWSISKLGRIAHKIGVSTAEQGQQLEKSFGFRGIVVHPIGSNILPLNKDDGLGLERMCGVFVTFGLPHTRLWTLQKHLPLIRDLQKRGYLKRLVSIGPIDNDYSKQEAQLALEHLGGETLVHTGVLPETEISKYFISAQGSFIGQHFSSLQKSGSFAALCAHAIPIICEAPATLDDPPGEFLFRPDEVTHRPEIIFNEEGESRRRALHEWFWTHRSWESIGARFRAWMN